MGEASIHGGAAGNFRQVCHGSEKLVRTQLGPTSVTFWLY